MPATLARTTKKLAGHRRAAANVTPRVKAGATVFIVGSLIDPLPYGPCPCFVRVAVPLERVVMRDGPMAEVTLQTAGIALP